MSDALLRFAEWIKLEDEFLLISHVSPDGDTIGSALALYGMLTGMGKRASLCCDQPVPRVYRFLPFSDVIQKGEEVKENYKNVIAVDCADMARMGNSLRLFEAAQKTGNIDHHRTNVQYGDFNLFDYTASATGELIYRLWAALEGAPEANKKAQQIATCLFAAICTDTGSFSYGNVSPETFRIAACLLEMGVDVDGVNREIYRTISIGRTKLKGFVLNNIELQADGRIAIVGLYQSDIDRFGAKSEDVEGIIDALRSVDTVEIAMLLREAKDDTYKVSFRSKKYADVSALAQQFGGGGHIRAAGCTIKKEEDMEALKGRLIKAAQKELE